MQNDLIKIKICRHGNRYAGQNEFHSDTYSFAYIHASDILDIADNYVTITRNNSVIRYRLNEPTEDVVNRITEKLNSKK